MSNRYDESAGRQEDYGRYGMARDRQDQGRYGAQGGEQRSWGDNSYSEYRQPRSQGAYGSIAHGSSNQPSGGGYSGGAAGGYGGFGGHGSQGGQGGYGPLYQGSSYGQDSSSFSRYSGPYDDRGSRGPSSNQSGYNQGQQWADDRYSSFSAGNPQHDPGGGYGAQGGPFTGQGGYSWDRDAGRGQGGGTYGQNDYSEAAQRSHWRTDSGPGQNRFAEQGYPQPARDPYAQGGPAQTSEHHHDPHYRQWRDQQLSGHDRDYAHWREQQAQRYDSDYKSWRDERHQAFSKDFDGWRSNRSEQASKGAGGQSLSDLQAGPTAGADAGQAAVEDVTDGGTGRHDEKERREEKH